MMVRVPAAPPAGTVKPPPPAPPTNRTEKERLMDSTKIEAVEVHPGDVIVVRMTDALDKDACESLTERLRECFPENKVLILDAEAAIEIYRVGKEGAGHPGEGV